MNNSDTAEYRAFQGCFDRLVNGIKNDVESVARKTFAKNLISSDNLSVAINQHQDIPHRATKLLQQVLDKIEQNPSCFNTFITILEEIPFLEELAGELIAKSKSDIICKTKEAKSLEVYHPWKPTATVVTHNSITLEWKTTDHYSENIESYLVKYRCDDDPNRLTWKNKLTDASCNTKSRITCTITGLSPQTKYIFKVRPELKDGSAGIESEVSNPIETTRPPCVSFHPSKPIVTNVFQDRITLRWENLEQYHSSEKIKSYLVRYRCADDPDKPWERKMTSSNDTELIITDLSPQTKYIFKILPELEDGGVGTESEISDCVTTKPSLAVHLFREAHSNKLLQKKGPPAVYQVPRMTYNYTMRDEEKKIAKCHFGDPKLGRGKRERVLMLVGAIKAGKSTLIECMVNYILGVKWEDKFRFRLIQESQASTSWYESQTRYITAYTFYPVEGSALDYTLTIIDTPGYGDTRGIEHDRTVTKQIKEFFSTTPFQGIDHIDGVGFVVKAGSARLTPTQRYIFDSILGVFGKDMERNIFLMVYNV